MKLILFTLSLFLFSTLNAQLAPNPFYTELADNSTDNRIPIFTKKPFPSEKQNDFQLLNVGAGKIAVISDTHIMSKELLVEDGRAYQAYLRKERKLLQESEAIAQATVEKLLAEKPDVVLVCGDLSKDGELLSHLDFTKTFSPLLKRNKNACYPWQPRYFESARRLLLRRQHKIGRDPNAGKIQRNLR